MSVIVKGLAMPESCEYCFFCMYMNCGQDVDYWCGIDNRPIENINIAKRLEDCPLVEMPEKHGRLIDENDVIDAIHERLHDLQMHKEFVRKHGDVDLLGVMPYIAKIRPVIEAEGSE